jgi:hypothetical protein
MAGKKACVDDTIKSLTHVFKPHAGCRWQVIAVNPVHLLQQGHQAALRLALLSAAEGMPPLGCILLAAEEHAAVSAPNTALAVPAFEARVGSGSGAPSQQLLLEQLVSEAVREVMGASGAGVDVDTPLMAAGEFESESESVNPSHLFHRVEQSFVDTVG